MVNVSGPEAGSEKDRSAASLWSMQYYIAAIPSSCIGVLGEVEIEIERSFLAHRLQVDTCTDYLTYMQPRWRLNDVDPLPDRATHLSVYVCIVQSSERLLGLVLYMISKPCSWGERTDNRGSGEGSSMMKPLENVGESIGRVECP